jgi:mycothiol system anti-sigma-R factor
MNKRHCEDAIANIYLYLDGELGRLHAAKIRHHLKHCEGCLSVFRFEEHIKQVVRDRVREEPKQEVIDRLYAYLEEHEPGFGSRG